MPRAEREYSRLYHDLVDDPMMAAVYPDDALFGAWGKLLMGADAAWPASAPLPFGMSKARLTKLEASGLVTITGSRYRIRGLDKEREKRSNAGKAGAKGRWDRDPGPDAPPTDEQSDGAPVARRPHTSPLSGGDAVASPSAMRSHSDRNAEGMPRRDETRRDKTSKEETRDARPPSKPNGHDTPARQLEALFQELTGLAYVPIRGSRQGDRLLRWVDKDGWPAVEREARKAAEDLGGIPELGQLVNTLDNYLHPPLSGRRLSAKEADAEEDAAAIAHLKDRARRNAEARVGNGS